MERLLRMAVSLCLVLSRSGASVRFCPNAGLVSPATTTALAGSTVELPCHPAGANSSSFRWTHNGRAVAGRGRRVDGTSGALTLPSVAPGDSGAYTCHGREMRFLSQAALLVGHRPEKPNVTCSSNNHHYIVCTWTGAQHAELPTHFMVNTTFANKHEECWRDDDLPRNSCRLTVGVMEYGWYVVTVTAINPLGCSRSDSDKFRLEDVLKPDPPRDVQLRWHQGALHVSWDYPGTWSKDRIDFPLDFQVCYRVAAASVCNKSPLLDTTEHIITDVLPSKAYVVQVSAIDKYIQELWSDWSPEASIAAIAGSSPLPEGDRHMSAPITTHGFTEDDTSSHAFSPDPPNLSRLTKGDTHRQKMYVAVGCTTVFFITTIVFIAAAVYARKKLAAAEPSSAAPWSVKAPRAARGPPAADKPSAGSPGPGAGDPDVCLPLYTNVSAAPAAHGHHCDNFYNMEYFYRGVEVAEARDVPNGVTHVAE